MLAHDLPFLEDAYDRASFLGRAAAIHSVGSMNYRFIERVHDMTSVFFNQKLRTPGGTSGRGIRYIDYVRMMALIAIERAGVRKATSIGFILARYNREVAEHEGNGAWEKEFTQRLLGSTVEAGMSALTMPWTPEGHMTDADRRAYDQRFSDMRSCDIVYAHLADGLTELLTIESAATGTERLRIYRRGRDHYLDLAGKTQVLWREIQSACNEAAAILKPIE